MRFLFTLLTFCLLSSSSAQDDLRYGKIKVRKPKPVTFYAELDYTPDYAVGILEDDIYENLAFPSGVSEDDVVLIMNVIIDQHGNVVWVEALDDPDPLLAEEAHRVLSNFVGRFIPYSENGRPVPASFQIPIRFKR